MTTQMKTGTVEIRDAEWSVTIARTIEQLTTGLSGVEELEEGQGMLFDLGALWPQVEIGTDKMLIPIDVVFIDSDLKVCGIKKNLEPNEIYLFEEPTLFFLEVGAGEVEAAGIEIGDSVEIKEVDSTPAPVPEGLTEGILGTVVSIGVNILIVMTVAGAMFRMAGKILR